MSLYRYPNYREMDRTKATLGSIGCSDLADAMALLKYGLEKDQLLIQQKLKEKTQ